MPTVKTKLITIFMCGIVGVISRRSPDEIDAAVRRAVQALSHRGPDDEGIESVAVCIDGWTIVFGQRRLAILDLSPAGHQPMHDAATGDWITYNGEVFNFRALRRQFEADGHVFHSESDTEVLLAGLSTQGLNAIADWRGMFALGWWDSSERQLTLVRDRFGIKPLYYYFDGENFIFASEVRALLATGLVPRRMSRAALRSYLAYGAIEQPLTLIERVYSVLPGHTLTFKEGRITSAPYWELRASANDHYASNTCELASEISELLAEAVRLRLVADVPIGVFLSGGIDSSAVAALLRRATTGNLESFSVCFEEKDFNERNYAERIARQFEMKHHVITLTEADVLAKLPSALAAMDQPSVDGINSYVVSEAVAQAGLKVAISGLGGDEVFAGYNFFRTIARDARRKRRAQLLPRTLRSVAADALGIAASGNRATKLRGLLRSNDLDEPIVRLYRRLFTSDQCTRLLVATASTSQEEQDAMLLRAWTNKQLANCATADPINQASALELTGYLSNTLLRDADTMSMAHSLEVRVPLIDHILVERMMRLPGEIKIRHTEPKWLLVEAVGNLPREIIDRPKQGFELPFKHWLTGTLSRQVEAALTTPRLADVFQAGALKKVWDDFTQGHISWSRVWSLYVIEEWAKLNL